MSMKHHKFDHKNVQNDDGDEEVVELLAGSTQIRIMPNAEFPNYKDNSKSTYTWKMLTSKPSSLEHDDDDCTPANDQQTTMPPNNNELVSAIAKTEPATTDTTLDAHKDTASNSNSNTAIAQHRNSGSRDSNGGKPVDTYIRTSKSSGHSNGGGGDNSNGDNADEDDGEETDIIGDLVGHFGKWQLLMTVLLSLFQVPNTFHISSSVYQAANKEFWCRRPAHLQHLPVDVWRNLSNSNDNCYQTPVDWSIISNDTNEQMHQQQSILKSLMENNNRTACSSWEYAVNDNVGNSWTSQWDLVCDKEYLKNVAEMFFLLGVATGGIISGYLSDKFGRKTMLFISAVLQTIFGLALYFAQSFEMYITLRALLGLVSVSVTYSGLILAIEYVDGKWRTIAGMYNLFPLPISYMLISGIAYLTQDYQRLQLCIGIPGIFLCFLWFVVPESPRWLLVKGRVEEVKRIIQAAADFNKRELPPNFESLLKPPTQEVSSQDFFCLFRSPYLRRITICFLCIWFTMNLAYYGFILNMSTFGGNVYLNSALAGLVEIPAIAIAIYIISKVGKKWLFSATLICAGIACCCAAITEGKEDILWLKITFIMIGKFTISAGNTIMPVYTAELYPTAIRNVGVGACNVAAGLALILTPYLSLLTKIEDHLLMSLLTAWCLFGGFVVLFLPETMKQHSKAQAQEEKC
ncbi:organic cation transporter protein isoform X1 [Lucilia cuprina]|uniref:organic cation transporter protein isoform X1 n=2 Tax=Lucilia cuprina TaxID=7375 RepID=UPI001F06154E|nr:organic cation transporter protein isoform X1 [Lucilia cuprina]